MPVILVEGERVDSLATYLSSLGDFTGVVKVLDGSTTFSFWLKNGEIFAAQINDGPFRVSGISALYLCNILAKVAKKLWSDLRMRRNALKARPSLKSFLRV